MFVPQLTKLNAEAPNLVVFSFCPGCLFCHASSQWKLNPKNETTCCFWEKRPTICGGLRNCIELNGHAKYLSGKYQYHLEALHQNQMTTTWITMILTKADALDSGDIPSLKLTFFAPKNGWLEYYFPIGEAYIQGLCWFQGGYLLSVFTFLPLWKKEHQSMDHFDIIADMWQPNLPWLCWYSSLRMPGINNKNILQRYELGCPPSQ